MPRVLRPLFLPARTYSKVPDMKRLVLFALLLAALPFGGCTAIQKALGMKTDLEGLPVTGLKPYLYQAPRGLCPGMAAPLIVEVSLEDGRTLKTEGAGGGKVTWDSFELSIAGGAVREDGLVTLHDDPRQTFGRPATLTVKSRFHPNLKPATLRIPARYDCTYEAHFDGEPGRDGRDGAIGRRGADGKDEISSGSYARPGGHGQAGGHGGDGAPGEAGRPGDDVEVFVTVVEHPRLKTPLLQVMARSLTRDHMEWLLVDPQAGRVKITANGGKGGDGGDGGAGGRGGSGGTGAPPGNGGDGGDGGDGADGGDGGDGGRITVRASPAAQPYLGVLSFENRGGAPGAAGKGGAAGSGGNAPSGGRSGRAGQRGQDGARNGRPGRDGPQPLVQYQEMQPLW